MGTNDAVVNQKPPTALYLPIFIFKCLISGLCEGRPKKIQGIIPMTNHNTPWLPNMWDTDYLFLIVCRTKQAADQKICVFLWHCSFVRMCVAHVSAALRERKKKKEKWHKLIETTCCLCKLSSIDPSLSELGDKGNVLLQSKQTQSETWAFILAVVDQSMSMLRNSFTTPEDRITLQSRIGWVWSEHRKSCIQMLPRWVSHRSLVQDYWGPSGACCITATSFFAKELRIIRLW